VLPVKINNAPPAIALLDMSERHGVTSPGDFSASITKASIKVVGNGAMPKPLRMPLDHDS
jgi:hypothetical protein